MQQAFTLIIYYNQLLNDGVKYWILLFMDILPLSISECGLFTQEKVMYKSYAYMLM
jgi:hypothetical protein